MITMNKMLANCNIAVIVFWRLDINNLDSALSYFNTLNGDVSVVLIQITINVGHQKYIPTRTHNRWGIILGMNKNYTTHLLTLTTRTQTKNVWYDKLCSKNFKRKFVVRKLCVHGQLGRKFAMTNFQKNCAQFAANLRSQI